MTKNYVFLIIFFCICNLYAQVERPIGVNLSSVTDYSSELIFTDGFKQAREWIVFETTQGAPWSSGLSVPLDDKGYPVSIPYDDGINPPQAVRTLLLNGEDGIFPFGDYRLIVQGSGTIRLKGAANKTYSTPLDTIVQVESGRSVILEINESHIDNPINDVKFIYPDYTNSYAEQEYTTEFLDFLEDFQTIRFMDWTHTNFSNVTTWADRTLPDYYTQSKSSGVAWEYVIDLCNSTRKDAWICIPHLADDDYIQELATLFKNNLDSDLKIYLEYSNETWNRAFGQQNEIAALATDFGYTGHPWELAWQYTAKRSADIFDIFETTYGETSSLVRVVASQATSSYVSNQILTYFNDPAYNPKGVKADALAVAPYFGGGVADEIVANDEVSSITIPQIIDRLRTARFVSFINMNDSKEVADTFGLDLLAYEGGQHLVATRANVNNEALTEKLIAVNRRPEMFSLYCHYMNYWYEVTGGETFAIFSSHSKPSKFGSWGTKETMSDTENAKYRGIISCVFDNNIPVLSSIEDSKLETSSLMAYPNPSFNGTFFLKYSLKNPIIKVYNTSGRDVTSSVTINDDNLSVSIQTKGIYIIKITGEGVTESVKVINE